MVKIKGENLKSKKEKAESLKTMIGFGRRNHNAQTSLTCNSIIKKTSL